MLSVGPKIGSQEIRMSSESTPALTLSAKMEALAKQRKKPPESPPYCVLGKHSVGKTKAVKIWVCYDCIAGLDRQVKDFFLNQKRIDESFFVQLEGAFAPKE